MITIKITNVEQVVEERKGWFAAHLGGLVVDLEAKVEETVIREIRKALKANGIRAVVRRQDLTTAEMKDKVERAIGKAAGRAEGRAEKIAARSPRPEQAKAKKEAKKVGRSVKKASRRVKDLDQE